MCSVLIFFPVIIALKDVGGGTPQLLKKKQKFKVNCSSNFLKVHVKCKELLEEGGEVTAASLVNWFRT